MLKEIVKIAIVSHSRDGYTRLISDKMREELDQLMVSSKVFPTDEIVAFPDELTEFDGLIFGSPTYFGSVSGEFKSFMDSTSKLWVKRGFRNKIAAGFTCANLPGGDQLSTLMQLCVFAAQHGMVWVGSDLMPKLPAEISDQNGALNKLGSWLGLSFKVRDDAGFKLGLDQEDRLAIHHFVKRVADFCMRLKTTEKQ